MKSTLRKLFTFAALVATVGVGAQTETLLTTIESRTYKDYKDGSFTTTDGKATVTFNNFVFNQGSDWGWYGNSEREMSVSAGEGYTITMCRFFTKDRPNGFDVTDTSFKVYLRNQRVYTGANGTGADLGQYGVTRIEVYGGETIEVTEEAVNTYSFIMPASDAKVFVDYYPAAVTSTDPTAVSGIHADDDIDLVGGGATTEGTLQYARTTEPVAQALDAFSETLPTAEGLTEAGTVYVWYRIVSDLVHSDSEILGPVEVNIAAALPTHDLIFSPANIHKIEDGKAVVKIDRRYRTGDITDGTIRAVKLGQTVTVMPVAGYELTANINVDVAADGSSASFQMPDDEFTLNYELVRQMEHEVSAVMGADRIRIQKTEDGPFEYVVPSAILPIVTDVIGETPLSMTLHTDYEYTLQEQDGEEWSDTETLSVGTFRLKITGKTLYEGVTFTPPFELYQGYEMVVPARSYATYYKEEPLYQEDEEMKIYTITGVDEESVTITELNVAAANTPLLVYNTADVAKTVLLIPADQAVDPVVTVADEFKGTLTDQEMGASSETVNYYVLQQNAFVKVIASGTIAAHRCWLEVGNQPEAQQPAARRLRIVAGGETTGVGVVETGEADAVEWYDISGRKLGDMPTRKGVYVMRPAKGSRTGKSAKKTIIR